MYGTWLLLKKRLDEEERRSVDAERERRADNFSWFLISAAFVMMIAYSIIIRR
jgi:hypothetical protein